MTNNNGDTIIIHAIIINSNTLQAHDLRQTVSECYVLCFILFCVLSGLIVKRMWCFCTGGRLGASSGAGGRSRKGSTLVCVVKGKVTTSRIFVWPNLRVVKIGEALRCEKGQSAARRV